MADILPPAPVEAQFGAYNWVDWYKKVRDAINNAGSVTWANIDFSGSNITSIATRNHNDLQNIQGGTPGEYYHLTAAEYAALGDAGWTYIQLASDFDTSSTSAVDITSLGFTPAANKTYVVEAMLLLQTTDATQGVRPGVGWSSGLTTGAAKIEVTNGSTTSVIKNLPYDTDGSADGTEFSRSQ
jgi:hypothetical protein